MSKDDIIALLGVILLLAGITITFGLGWSLMTAGVICIYAGMRLETKDERDSNTDST